MSQRLCITFRFVQPFPVFHGRGDADVPEWPPSPMRAFQALLNAASLRARGNSLAAEVRSALEVLESVRPEVIAPRAAVSSVGYRAYVPHNQADLVTAAWHRGNLDASVASHRMEKDIRPMRIECKGDKLPAVHYLYPLDTAAVEPHALLAAIRPAVRSIHCLGWGIDQVIGDAVLFQQDGLAIETSERWRPVHSGGRRFRVPTAGTLDALVERHEQFLKRLIDNSWTPVPPLSASIQARYRRDNDPDQRPNAVFKLVDEDEDTFRYPHAKLVHVAGMTRHAAIQAMTRNPPHWIKDADWASQVVRGKKDGLAGDHHQQFSYVPLPSIGHAHSDAMVRNVMVIAPLGLERELNYLAEQLDSQVLEPESEWESFISDSEPSVPRRIELRKFQPPSGKFIDTHYLGMSRVWQSVTPVILDGHNDKKAAKTIKLIQAALQRAGIYTPCRFTWQSAPFFKHCLSAHKYDSSGRHTGYHRPEHLKDRTAVHVRLEFDYGVAGPITIGAGRHCGFGLFAALDD